MVKAGLKAIYLSGWQVAADANLAGDMYPDQSLYPANSVPAGRAAHQPLPAACGPDRTHGGRPRHLLVRPHRGPTPRRVSAGPLNAFELMKAMIEAGAAGVHFEDQLASEKKCGHLGGKVLVPTSTFIRTLNAARPRGGRLRSAYGPGGAHGRETRRRSSRATWDERDAQFLTGERTPRGLLPHQGPVLDQAIARGLAYAPYCDLVWCETSKPDLAEAKRFAEDPPRGAYPGKLLAYNCSPSFNWKKHLDDADHRQVPA